MDFLRRLRPGASQADTLVLLEVAPTAPWLDIRGETAYQAEICRAIEEAGGSGTAVATLVPEPDNAHDPNAVTVAIAGDTVGYLSRGDALAYGPPIRQAAGEGRWIGSVVSFVERTSRTTGRPEWRVRLGLGAPAEYMRVLVGHETPAVFVRREHPWQDFVVTITGDSRYALLGMPLDRGTMEDLAKRVGISVEGRVTRRVQLLIDCDPGTESQNQRRAAAYGIPVISEGEFWDGLGVAVEPLS